MRRMELRLLGVAVALLVAGGCGARPSTAGSAPQPHAKPSAGSTLQAAPGVPPLHAQGGKAAEPPEMTFDGQGIWFASARVYPSGLHPVESVTAPVALEQAVMQFGTPQHAALRFAKGMTQASPTGRWMDAIPLSGLHAFTVDKVRYALPASASDALLLPIAAGIVWAVHDPSHPHVAAPSASNGFPPDSQDLSGSTTVFFTPYRASGGSLAAGARPIAVVPDAWPALSGPVADSAWTGFLPPDAVAPPVHARLAAHAVWDGPSGSVERAAAVGSVPGWPTAMLAQAPPAPSGQAAGFVTGLQLDRTAGGFVLQVMLGIGGGGQAGITECDYYWSAGSGQWTPLAQLYEVATLVSFTDVGSGAVYWQLTLPAKDADQGALVLLQERFNPTTRGITPVWAGNFIYGQSFVDGTAWVRNLPSATGAARWSANAP